MPYRLSLSAHAQAQIRSFRGQHLFSTARLLGGFPHDNWAQGEVHPMAEVTGQDVRFLELGAIRMTYQLRHEAEEVHIISVDVID